MSSKLTKLKPFLFGFCGKRKNRAFCSPASAPRCKRKTAGAAAAAPAAQKIKKNRSTAVPLLCWHQPIVPGRLQPSIVGTSELNFCVRNGNRWTLVVINTNYFVSVSSDGLVMIPYPSENCKPFFQFFLKYLRKSNIWWLQAKFYPYVASACSASARPAPPVSLLAGLTPTSVEDESAEAASAAASPSAPVSSAALFSSVEASVPSGDGSGDGVGSGLISPSR